MESDRDWPVAVAPEVVIARPRAEVAAFMFDPANDPIWTKNVKSVRVHRAGRLRPGARVERVVRFLGREFGYRYEVTDAGGDEFVQMAVARPFPMRIRYELDDLGSRTRARIRAVGDPTGFFRAMGPLMPFVVASSIRADLRTLKRVLERA